MKIDANSIRVGDVLEHNSKLWVVLKTMHTQPGKGGAYMQIEMKAIQDGTKLNIRFRSSESVEKAHLDSKDVQYLYTDGDKIVLMDMLSDDYAQFELDIDLLGELKGFLKDGMTLLVRFHGDKAISASLPQKVECTVVECEPVVKGQTAASSYKPAVLDNGFRIMVPPFININDVVIINTETLTYEGRS